MPHHTERERHAGKDVWLTRKGAIDASALVPGSMGTRCYVVTGLGDVASFPSAPHGRSFARTEARRRVSVGEPADADKD